MRVVIAPDKFKGTLSAAEAARAIAAGWRREDPGAELVELPIADGGEGTLDALLAALGGRRERLRVTGPLGDPVDAAFGLADAPDGLLAVVEMARASGLSLVSEGRRDPLRATTAGTGELLAAAARHGANRILVCIGGSATNDGGAGAAHALGVRFLDAADRELPPGGAALRQLARIDATGLSMDLRTIDVVVATDVDNPLTGPTGASAVFGPQKGATPEQVGILEEGLRRLATVVVKDLAVDIRDLPGGGAAGGLGAGLVAFLGARLRRGFDVVAEALGLREQLAAAEVAVTGEGMLDEQTEHGKAPAGLVRLGREAGCRTVVLAGQIRGTPGIGADLVLSLAERAGLEEAMNRPGEVLAEVAAHAARAMREDR